jgi:HK97 family phage prohead protease
LHGVETRAGSATFSGNVAEGYAVVFGQKEAMGEYYIESVAKGAFKPKNYYRSDVLALWNHKWESVLGRLSAGTLQLEERQHGLWFRLQLDERSPAGMTALSALDRGEVFGCSFGFKVLAESWTDPENSLPERVITDVLLYEISLCPMPAYEGTTVSLVRNANDNAQSAVRRIRQKVEAAHRLRGIQ